MTYECDKTRNWHLIENMKIHTKISKNNQYHQLQYLNNHILYDQLMNIQKIMEIE